MRELERRYGPIDPIIKKEPEMFRLVIEMMRVDLGMLEGYRYYHESAFDCPILAIGGTEDPTLTECELEAWSAQTTGRFSVRRLPGSHFFLRTAGPELRELVVRALEW